LIAAKPNPNLGIVVTIPCYNEPELEKSLASLAYCHPVASTVEVIVVINHSNKAPELVKAQNLKTYKQAQHFASIYNTEHLQFHILLEELPERHAGVGLARKIAMDEAARRLDAVDRPEGIIACFDADSTCLDNYFLLLEQYFSQHPKSPGCSIYFEHPLKGDLQPEIYEAITEYELFLRYYVHALRYAGFPYAYQTIGSSMAVRNGAYQKQGGMNRRKAGEDFYFLHKLIPLGNFGEITKTKVIPSPRKSDRVPFGTGKAVGQWLSTKNLDTYHPNIFEDLKLFYTKLYLVSNYKNLVINDLSGYPESIVEYSKTIELQLNIERIKENSGSLNSFISNFHHWFDGLKVLKYIHFARDNFYANTSIVSAAKWALEAQGFAVNSYTAHELLEAYRKIDQRLSGS
ncbi:MAG: hypothetical protein AAF843_20395, partial [Bacteroidota bacterium]